MDISVLEREILNLPTDERARLVKELLDSLDNIPSEELDRLRLEQASRRAIQIDNDAVTLVPAEEVDQKVRALLR